MAALPEDVVNTIAIANVKAIAEQPAMLSNLAYSNMVFNTNQSQQNAVANQQAMNELCVSILARLANTLKNQGLPDPLSAPVNSTNDDSQKPSWT
jgi:hypothetical protein